MLFLLCELAMTLRTPMGDHFVCKVVREVCMRCSSWPMKRWVDGEPMGGPGVVVLDRYEDILGCECYLTTTFGLLRDAEEVLGQPRYVQCIA